MASYATDSSPLQLYWQKEATRERSKLQVWRSRVNTEISMIDDVSLLVKKQQMTNASEKKKKRKNKTPKTNRTQKYIHSYIHVSGILREQTFSEQMNNSKQQLKQAYKDDRPQSV